MNFDYSEDQKFIQEQARKFLSEQCPLSRVRKVLESSDDYFDTELWRQIAEMGWQGIAIPENYGGLGLTPIELGIIAEELGRVLAPVPFSSTVYFVADMLLRHGSDDQKQAWLPAIAQGDVIGCVALSQRPGGFDPDHVDGIVKDGKLSGQYLPVADGAIADVAIVLASEGSELSAFIVDLDQSAVKRTDCDIIDPSRGAAKLEFDGASVERLGPKNMGADLAREAIDRAAALVAFEQIGGAESALMMARDYSLERQAFGRPIGSFQALKHRMVEAYSKIEIARSHAYFGGWALSSDAGGVLATAAAAARVAASDAFWFAAKENIQIHGGIGFTWEMDCHLFYRRAQYLGALLGAAPEWRERLVETIEKQNAEAA